MVRVAEQPVDKLGYPAIRFIPADPSADRFVAVDAPKRADELVKSDKDIAPVRILSATVWRQLHPG